MTWPGVQEGGTGGGVHFWGTVIARVLLLPVYCHEQGTAITRVVPLPG